jgi:hypothetical protein
VNDVRRALEIKRAHLIRDKALEVAANDVTLRASEIGDRTDFNKFVEEHSGEVCVSCFRTVC